MKILCLAILAHCCALCSELRVLLTTALIEDQYEERKEEYIETLSILNDFGFRNPYIIESICSEKTFLNNYSENVIYPNVNNFHLRNKGVNEGNAIRHSLDKLPFQDGDMVVKITGRYHLLSDTFLKTIQSHPSIDVFAKLAPDGQVYTGCFAMRYRYFKELFGGLDDEKMEREMINIERVVAHYIQRIAETENAYIMYVDKLDLIANIFGSGDRKIVEL